MRKKEGIAALLLLGLTGCPSERDRTCETALNSAQGTVQNVDSSSLDSVQQSLDAVGTAVAACKKANKTAEVSQLVRAQHQLSGHLDMLREREAEKARKQLALVDLERYVKDGDPNCPRGQAYRERVSAREVKCIGPQPANMPFAIAEKYFTLRGYKVRHEGKDLKAEYGGELYVFRYEAETDPPVCLKMYPPPGMGWQEAVARFTGIRPDKLKNPGTVRLAQGEKRLSVDESAAKLIAVIGTCW
jgi:hypothetical protein